METEISTPTPTPKMQVAPLAGWEKIWLAQLSLASDYSTPEGTELPPLPDDDLARLIQDPWTTVNPFADLPTGYPATILFFYEEQGEESYSDTLTAEGICSTSYITVRKPLLTGVAAPGMAKPFFYEPLMVTGEPVLIRLAGGLAYAHYHLADEVAQKFAYYYAITRDPRFLADFLNQKDKELWIDDDTTIPAPQFDFAIATDGTFRVIYETLTTGPTPPSQNAFASMASDDVIPCIKLVGVVTTDSSGNTITVNTVMIIPYLQSPDPG